MVPAVLESITQVTLTQTPPRHHWSFLLISISDVRGSHGAVGRFQVEDSVCSPSLEREADTAYVPPHLRCPRL